MGAFLAPILVIIVLNVIIFVCVVIVVIRHARDKAARTNRPIGNKTVLRLMFSISGILFLFGLTWLFLILTFSVPGLRETFQILFTIFNSLQGFFVFTFIFFTEGFGYWKTIISCETLKSKLIQSSFETCSSKQKQYNNDPTPSTEERRNNYSESSQNVLINRKDSIEIPNSTEASESKALQLPTGLASITESVDDDSSSLQQNMNVVCQSNGYNNIITGHGSQARELEKKQSNPKPLKIAVRRYTTMVQKRHHVEEMKADLESSDSDGEGS